ncbi:MAG: hypothetical protein IH875_10865 [Candidatus Dadabacteria bacterium]|nr:hypothetical protein [Candidatus Dadabacteria bacterium]
MNNEIEKRKRTDEYYEEWRLIASELRGLYLEADKLSKKSPATKISKLELESTNYVINRVKTLISEDPFIDRLQEFVPAGDNPEYREILLVLRQLIQGMNRYIPNKTGQISI